MHHGHCPAELDHIDNDVTNNRIENLQAITHRRNTRKDKSPESGYHNVHRGRKKWEAQVRMDEKNQYIGTYNSPLEAAQAVVDFLNSKGIPTTIEDLKC